MNWRRFFSGLPSITTVVLGILSFVSNPISGAVVSPKLWDIGLPGEIRCPELFQVLSTELIIPSGYWRSVCYGNHIDSDNSGDESGSGDESNIDVCRFVCNDYHGGCRELANQLFSNEIWVRRLGCTKQNFLKVCIGWQEYIRETNHNRTTTQPSTTTMTTTPTITPTTSTRTISSHPTAENSGKKEQNTQAWDICILTVLGVAIASAGGVAIYFWRKKT